MLEAIATGKRGFYGWWLVGAIFMVLTTTAGLGFYNASVILRSAKVELNASVTVVSGATALFFGVSGITGFALSKAMDRVDIRWFYASGAVIGGGALAGLRFVDSIFGLYVFFVVFGVGFATAGLVPSVTVVARWFEVKRSVALSIASTGLSVGGIVITPVVARMLDSRTLAEMGPRMGLVWLVGVLPISWLLIRSWPADMGLRPYGATELEAAACGIDGAVGAEVTRVPGATFADARRTRFFRLLAATYAVTFFAQVGALAQLFNLVTERQSTDVAASVLSILALSSVCGRLIGGVVVTRVSITSMTGALILVQGAALAAVAVADSPSGLRLAAALFGVSVGNILMLQPLLLAEAFGVREYSRIYSFNQMIGTAGVAGGPFVLGFLRDFGDYRSAFLFAAVCNVLAFVLFKAAGSVESARSSWR